MPKVIKGGPGPQPSAPTTSRPAAPAPQPLRPAPPPSRPVPKQIIEREVVGATAEARRILGEAEEEAGRMLEEARTQAEELRQRGYDEGYQEGLGQYTEATAKALRDIELLKLQLEPEYIALVRACVEKILGQELKLTPDTIVGVVRNALRDATQQREIMVRVHPEDAEALRKNQRRLLDVLARANNIEVREDPSVARGGCIVVTELGMIDASLERQLKALEKVLEDELAVASAEAEGAAPAEYAEGGGEPEYAEEES